MTVTDIVKDKNHCVKVVFDNGSEVLLDLDLFAEVSIHKGTELQEDELSALEERSQYLRAKSRALWCLDRASYSEKGLYDKLILAKFSKKTSAAVIKRLKELGLVDDVRYAQRLCEHYTAANVSKREMFYKMYQKGIPKEIINDTISSCEIDETSQINALLEKKYKEKLQSKQDLQKVYAALIRKGFSYGAVKDALRSYIDQSEWEE